MCIKIFKKKAISLFESLTIFFKLWLDYKLNLDTFENIMD